MPPGTWASTGCPPPIHDKANASAITIPWKEGWVFMREATTLPRIVKRAPTPVEFACITVVVIQTADKARALSGGLTWSDLTHSP